MGETIAIISGKGGVGKTVITANLGLALAMQGKKVIVVDGDLGLRNLDIVMGLEDKVMYNIVDVIKSNCEIEKAIIKDKRYDGLYLMPTAQFIDEDTIIEKEEINSVYNKLKKYFDYVLIDTPSGLSTAFKKAAYNVDKAIAVVLQDNSSIRDSDRVIRKLREEGITNIKLIFNKYEPNSEEFNIDYISEDLCIDYIGAIPESKQIINNANNGILINGTDEISNIFINIAQKIDKWPKTIKKETNEQIIKAAQPTQQVVPPAQPLATQFEQQPMQQSSMQETSKPSVWNKIKEMFKH